MVDSSPQVLVVGGPEADPERVGALVAELERGSGPTVEAVIGLSTRPNGPAVGTIDGPVAAQLGVAGVTVLGIRPDRYIGLRDDSGDPQVVREHFSELVAQLRVVAISHREPEIAAFAREHLEGVLDLCAAEGWDLYTEDPERTYDALVAAGSTTLVALDGPSVVAMIQVQSDGVIQAHLSAIVVGEQWRGAGLGRLLLREGLARAGGVQIDIRTRAESYYVRLGATQSAGFRLTRSDLGL